MCVSISLVCDSIYVCVCGWNGRGTGWSRYVCAVARIKRIWLAVAFSGRDLIMKLVLIILIINNKRYCIIFSNLFALNSNNFATYKYADNFKISCWKISWTYAWKQVLNYNNIFYGVITWYLSYKQIAWDSKITDLSVVTGFQWSCISMLELLRCMNEIIKYVWKYDVIFLISLF